MIAQVSRLHRICLPMNGWGRSVFYRGYFGLLILSSFLPLHPPFSSKSSDRERNISTGHGDASSSAGSSPASHGSVSTSAGSSSAAHGSASHGATDCGLPWPWLRRPRLHRHHGYKWSPHLWRRCWALRCTLSMLHQLGFHYSVPLEI